MFSIDARLRGIPVSKEQVVSLWTSVNQPHLAVPGKQPGAAQAFIVGVRVATGFAVFVYLYLSQSADCAVYTSGRRDLTAEEFEVEEQDALAFSESMGFMMDTTNFRQLPPDQQDDLMGSPVFLKDPSLAAPPAGAEPRSREEGPRPTAALGRLFSSF